MPAINTSIMVKDSSSYKNDFERPSENTLHVKIWKLSLQFYGFPKESDESPLYFEWIC